jgi:hypothetical protein
MSERLDRIEALLERMAEQREADRREIAEQREADRREIAEQRQADRREIAEQREADRRQMLEQREADQREMAELRSAVTSLVQIAEIHQQNFDRIWDEIRGMRIESQRILEHLFGQQGNGQ